jgi:hypothetical protein
MEALTWQPHPGADNNIAIQYKILQELTLPVRQEQVLFLCTTPDSEAYGVRRTLMGEAAENLRSEAHGAAGGELAELMMTADTLHMPKPLAYHCKLLDVLAGTAVGRLNITTVEAKLQVVFSSSSSSRRRARFLLFVCGFAAPRPASSPSRALFAVLCGFATPRPAGDVSRSSYSGGWPALPKRPRLFDSVCLLLALLPSTSTGRTTCSPRCSTRR